METTKPLHLLAGLALARAAAPPRQGHGSTARRGSTFGAGIATGTHRDGESGGEVVANEWDTLCAVGEGAAMGGHREEGEYTCAAARPAGPATCRNPADTLTDRGRTDGRSINHITTAPAGMES